MTRQPRGAVMMPPWVWDISRVAGGFDLAQQNGSFAHIAVYNNAQDGTYLWILAVDMSTSNNEEVIYEMGVGNFNIAAPVAGAGLLGFGPIVGGAPALPGLFGHFFTAGCVANHIGGTGNAQVAEARGAYGFPLAVLPPGYSFICEAPGTSATILGGMWWWAGPRPRH